MEPQLRVQVVDDEIVVSVPGFRYSATYYNLMTLASLWRGTSR
jgi:hypothetical protein